MDVAEIYMRSNLGRVHSHKLRELVGNGKKKHFMIVIYIVMPCHLQRIRRIDYKIYQYIA